MSDFKHRQAGRCLSQEIQVARLGFPESFLLAHPLLRSKKRQSALLHQIPQSPSRLGQCGSGHQQPQDTGNETPQEFINCLV